MNNNAFWNLSYGVYIISVWDGERPTGCTANCAMQITAEPPTIAISINHDNYTNQCIEKTGKFAISILGYNSDPSIIGTFGFKTGKEIDKFASVSFEKLAGMPVVKDACAYIACEVINKMETDTHTVFLGRVFDADILSDKEPITYSYYHKVLKGKSPKNAPTYIADNIKVNSEIDSEASEGYVCSICKYQYSGDIPFEELPEDYKCPICGQPKAVFKKQV
ncbi:flavin reductase (DIM6/NTAB) family NADH-FMN oxidoreductase RutF [Ruminiclostridium sufflavum DSM 19573]|uniref:Flavin reductase (DIM6/NTAB) family NADH-FMN oxidoreductase RutF n=1 Tax=Ruminiclostridium sufflavum DSM 19573 TaxID=1121337 RepID=A0A318XPR2_9FIRM|nr:flavin reductase [Ruminiclostridium sufflavum]PYG89874.1 flavin reductase (DIM6/NTAB) family NADH-FMN oxidoreductase RutF [Ruminiclostridium sufflavum DSM 19573]